MPIYYTLHTLIYKYDDLIPLPKSSEDRHCLMILGGTVAWTIIWIALNSIQNHPLWNSLRSSFIAILTADISVMLYIWNKSKIDKSKLQRKVIQRQKNMIPINHTKSALNKYYDSIQAELDVRSRSNEGLKAKAEQEEILKKMDAVLKIQKYWRNKRKRNKGEEFHSILSTNAL